MCSLSSTDRHFPLPPTTRSLSPSLPFGAPLSFPSSLISFSRYASSSSLDGLAILISDSAFSLGLSPVGDSHQDSQTSR